MPRSTKGPNPVDVHVGGRVRQRRLLLGITQTDLAKGLGLTFQQVQKYERGVNRIGASRLFGLSRILVAPIGYFFDDMPVAVATKSPALLRGRAKEPVSYDLDSMAKRETLEFVRAYYKIPDLKVRKCLFELVKTFAGVSEDRA